MEMEIALQALQIRMAHLATRIPASLAKPARTAHARVAQTFLQLRLHFAQLTSIRVSLVRVTEVGTVSMRAMQQLTRHVATFVSAAERATVLASALGAPLRPAVTAHFALLRSVILRTEDALLVQSLWELVAEFANQVRSATQQATVPEEFHCQVAGAGIVFRVELVPMVPVWVEHSFRTGPLAVEAVAYAFLEFAAFKSRSNGVASPVL